jgi:predicted Ser/Thr protein kinase
MTIESSWNDFEKQYQLLEELGAGGMGRVQKAIQISLNRPVALKWMGFEHEDNQNLRERFLTEGRVLARLSHPNIVQVYDLGIVEGRYFLAMELVEGCDLAHLRRERKPGDLVRHLEILGEMLVGLMYLHERGILHRDLKPGNVLVAANGRVKLSDFGLCLDTAQGNLTTVGRMMGSPAYLAPERWFAGPIGPSSDLYSIGVMLHEMLTGQFPRGTQCDAQQFMQLRMNLDPAPISVVKPGIAPELTHLVDDLLRRDPDSRPRSASEVKKRLDLALQSSPAALLDSGRDCGQPGPTVRFNVRDDRQTRVVRSAPRNRSMWLGSALALGICLLLLARFMKASGPSPARADAKPLARTLVNFCKVEGHRPVACLNSLQDAQVSRQAKFERLRSFLHRSLLSEIIEKVAPLRTTLLFSGAESLLTRQERAAVFQTLQEFQEIDRLARIEGLPLATGLDALLEPEFSYTSAPEKPVVVETTNTILPGIQLPLRRDQEKALLWKPANLLSTPLRFDVTEPRRFRTAWLKLHVTGLRPFEFVQAALRFGRPKRDGELRLHVWARDVESRLDTRTIRHSFDASYLEPGPNEFVLSLGQIGKFRDPASPSVRGEAQQIVKDLLPEKVVHVAPIDRGVRLQRATLELE